MHPEYDADISKHVAVLTIYKTLLLCIYIYIYIYSGVVGADIKSVCS